MIGKNSGCPFAHLSPQELKKLLAENQNNPWLALSKLHEKHGESVKTETSEGTLIFDHQENTARALLMGTEGEEPRFKKSELQTHGISQALGPNNLLLQSGPSWEASRTALEPLFSSKQVRSDTNIQNVSNILDRHFDKIEKQFQGQEEIKIDLQPLLRNATLDVALHQMFSTHNSDSQLDELRAAYTILGREVGRQWILPSSETGLSPDGTQLKQARGVIQAWAENLLDARLGRPDQPQDALSALMAATDPITGEAYSRDRLSSEIQNLMLAGHETTANLISWTITDLARSPAEQSQVASDIQSKIGTNSPTAKDLRKFKNVFLLWREQAIEHPPNYLIAREAIKDTTIGSQEAPIQIEAGTTVVVSTEHANDGRQLFSFGGGQRFCLGFNLARLETEMAVIKFLQRFEIADQGPRGVESGITQHPEDTIVTLKKRTQSQTHLLTA